MFAIPCVALLCVARPLYPAQRIRLATSFQFETPSPPYRTKLLAHFFSSGLHTFTMSSTFISASLRLSVSDISSIFSRLSVSISASFCRFSAKMPPETTKISPRIRHMFAIGQHHRRTILRNYEHFASRRINIDTRAVFQTIIRFEQPFVAPYFRLIQRSRYFQHLCRLRMYSPSVKGSVMPSSAHKTLACFVDRNAKFSVNFFRRARSLRDGEWLRIA